MLNVAIALLALHPLSPAVERDYADFNDAYGAVSLIDSNPGAFPDQTYAGKSRSEWQQVYVSGRSRLVHALKAIDTSKLSAEDARAVRLMRDAVAEPAPTPRSLAPAGHCGDATQDLPLQKLQEALYACFTELANNLEFENGQVTRVAAFDLLARMVEPQRRKSLFMAFVPLWRALNADGAASSPYRRMIGLAAAESRRSGSPIDAAARTIGVSSAEIERWLESLLDTWRQVSGDSAVEPWDFRFENGAADRELGAAIPRAALPELNQRYYSDLGLDLAAAGVIYDLGPRPTRSSLAYTDYVRRGRVINGAWQPTITRVSASYAHGGLGPLNELVHENGHVVHMMALHTRPAFMDLGDAIFFEAFADVPSWSVYETDWQQQYLGRSASAAASLRTLYSGVLLDVAWALFDLRMLRDPHADPNQVWTRITGRYLRIKPHPSWPGGRYACS